MKTKRTNRTRWAAAAAVVLAIGLTRLAFERLDRNDRRPAAEPAAAHAHPPRRSTNEPWTFAIRLDAGPVQIWGVLHDGMLIVEGTLGDAAQPLGNLGAILPVDVSLHPPRAAISPAASLQARFRLDADLVELPIPLDAEDHRYGGRLHADVRLDGTAAEPRVNGEVRLRGGMYEHMRWGILIKDAAILLTGDRAGLRIEEATATDGRSGRIEARGRLALDTLTFPFDTEFAVHDALLVRHDLARIVADGKLRWHGDRAQSRLEGRIVLGPVEAYIPERMPYRIRDLPYLEADGPPSPPASPMLPAPPARTQRHDTSLDVAVEAPNRIFVRGRGLDSEWSASARLSESLHHPLVTGHVDILRGRLVLFGRRMTLTAGRLDLDGRNPGLSRLDVTAEARSGEYLIRLRVRGTVDDPAIGIEASPPLPEDEALAVMLFGRTVDGISAWQALTLARAVHTLRSGGSAMDFMGRTRRLLRVDQIDIGPSDTHDDTSLRLGTYLSDRVFLEVEQGIGADTGRVSVEIELTPSLRLLGDTGTAAGAALGIRWSWDY